MDFVCHRARRRCICDIVRQYAKISVLTNAIMHLCRDIGDRRSLSLSHVISSEKRVHVQVVSLLSRRDGL